MTFGEKVRFLRALPRFKVIPISEVRAIAFVAKVKDGRIILTSRDIQKILREYPDLESRLA